MTAVRPCSTARLRQQPLLASSSRPSAQPSVTRPLARRRLCQPLRSRHGSMDAEMQSSADVAALEQLYLSSDQAAAVLSLSSLASQDEGLSSGSRSEELCGKMICVEHTVDDISGEVLVTDPSPPGLIGRLLDLLPISKRTRGIVMLNLLVILVASNWVVVKDVGNNFDPFGFAFLRFAVAAAAFSPFLKAASKDKRIMAAGFELGVWTAAGYIAQSAGLLTTDASRASFLSTFTVLVVPFLAGLSGKGVSAVTWASCLAALVGVGLLEQGGAPAGVGDIWSFASAVAFGVQVFRTEHHARKLGNSANLPLMSVVLTTTMLFAALAAGLTHPDAVMNMIHHPMVAENMLTGGHLPWTQVFYTGLLTTDLALMMEIFALQDVSSVDAAIIYTLEPVLGAALAWGMLGERLGAKGLIGAAIILASSLVTQVMGGKGEADAEPKLLSVDKED
ncbi:hypothetical protein D9Q98_004868 [Chlorella vulgaris]|uniref:EamA domain-containing protein n=1 Tax=Chlorella vulgaris TaxID=3077 RepID=A0A9D4YWI7_CHLVU|nr:hypothetical protein D9Q98_004868 [Chlorella vulgaris]